MLSPSPQDRMRGELALLTLGREQWQLGAPEDVPPTSAAVPQLILARVALQALLQQENLPPPPAAAAAQRGVTVPSLRPRATPRFFCSG